MPTYNFEINKDSRWTFNSVDYSGMVTSIAITVNGEKKTTTNMESDGWEESLVGIFSGEMAVSLNADVDQSTFEAAVWTLFKLRQPVPTTVKSRAGTTAATLAEWQGNVNITSFNPVSGSVGDVKVMTYTWPFSGEIVRDIT
jgi:hypothetical protein